MKLIDSEKAIDYAKEKNYIKTSGQEEALREVFALATVEAVPIDVIDKIRADINTLYGVYNSHFKEQLVIKSDVMRILDEHISELKGGSE